MTRLCLEKKKHSNDKILYLTYYLLEYGGKIINKEDCMVFLHHKIFQASSGLSVYHKRWFYFSCFIFQDHHNLYICFSATKIKGIRVSDFHCISKDCHTSYLKNVHLE